MLFVDAVKWDTFFQMAAGLRRHGWGTVRMSTERDPAHRLMSALVFRRFLGWPDPGRLDEVAQSAPIADIQATEGLLGAVVAALGPWASDELGTSLRARLGLVDKLSAGEHIRRVGAHAPDAMALDPDTNPDAVLDRLGLPVIVKPRIGSSGAGVHIARTAVQLETILEGNRGGGERFFAERCIDGEPLSYGAVVGPDGIEQEILTKAWRRGEGSLGPLTMHETIADPDLIDLCRRVATVPGYRGPVQIDMLRDADGTAWFHDLNLRAWADIGSTRQAGIDMAEGYLHAIGVTVDQPQTRSAPPGVRYSVFPTDAAELVTLGQPLRAARSFARGAVRFARWYGLRYVLAEVISILYLFGYVSREALRTRRTGPAPAKP